MWAALQPIIMSRRSLKSILITSLVAAVAACAPGEEVEDGSESALGEASDVWATESWKDRTDWYRTSQGSQLLDYGVFMALERGGAEAPFVSRENLSRFGFVYPMDDAVGSLTEDARLPVGIVKDRADKRDYAGLTCAACHTGEIEIKREGKLKRILVDGGQTWLDLEPFLSELQDALTTTQSDADKLSRFCKTLGGAETECKTRLEAAKDRIDKLRARNKQTVADGPGRLDAVSRILNEVFSPKEMGGQIGGEKPKNVEVPVSIPHVWDAPRLRCVQTNCLSTNSMTRNTGEVLGVFGHSNIVRDGGTIKIASSVHTDNLLKLEKALESLSSPKWEDNFGSLRDTDEKKKKLKNGELLFEQHCASCHTEPYKNGPNSIVKETSNTRVTRELWNVITKPYKEVGTDPRFIEVHGSRYVDGPDSGDAKDIFEQALKNKVGDLFENRFGHQPILGLTREVLFLKAREEAMPGGKLLSLFALGAVTATIERTEVAVRAKSEEEQYKLRSEYEFNRAPAKSSDLAVYRARPLNGIAFTYPYGHNGSWPTLWDVLTPPNDRPTNFVVRPKSFDEDKVGLDTSPAKEGEQLFSIDTTTLANSNLGHPYGTDLDDTEKKELLQYLKSL